MTESAKSLAQPLKSLIVCADDFGLESGVNDAIIKLAQQGRISATGCLVQAPDFSKTASQLSALPIDLGLHLNFTEPLGQSGLCLPLGRLLLRAYTRTLSAQAVREQIETQLDLFERHLGRSPDFIDGHLHVHQFPVIRVLLLEVIKRRYPTKRPWVRDTRPATLSQTLPVMQRWKASLIGALGAGALTRLTQRAGIVSNRGFLGAYDFDRPHPDYARMLQAWLSHATDGLLLMVHPATHASATLAFGLDRVKEYEVLSGSTYVGLLDEYGLQVTRLSGR